MPKNNMKYGICELDIHGMTAYQAKIKVDRQLKTADRSIYRIRIIHGYHSGTALKEMLLREYYKHPKILRIEAGANDGITDLILRELL